MRVWKTGEAVQITCQGRTIPGIVELASPNGKSLGLTFEAVLAGWVGMMLVSWDDETQSFYSAAHHLSVSLAVELSETEQEED